ncbi:unnamed protein product, partial [Ectocarpus sp. 12 AP-2014]
STISRRTRRRWRRAADGSTITDMQLIDAGRLHLLHIQKHEQVIRLLLSPRPQLQQLHAVEKGRRRGGNRDQNPSAACVDIETDSNNQFTANVNCSLLTRDC